MISTEITGRRARRAEVESPRFDNFIDVIERHDEKRDGEIVAETRRCLSSNLRLIIAFD